LLPADERENPYARRTRGAQFDRIIAGSVFPILMKLAHFDDQIVVVTNHEFRGEILKNDHFAEQTREISAK
jgi:hypothetical protein